MATQIGSTNWNSVNNWFAANGIAPVQQNTDLNPFQGLGNISTQSNQQISSMSGMDLNGADELRKLGLGNTMYEMAGVSQKDASRMLGYNPYTGGSLSYGQAFEGLAESTPDYLPGVKQSLSAVDNAMDQLFGGASFNSGSDDNSWADSISDLPDIPEPVETTAADTTPLPDIPEPVETVAANTTPPPAIPEPVQQPAQQTETVIQDTKGNTTQSFQDVENRKIRFEGDMDKNTFKLGGKNNHFEVKEIGADDTVNLQGSRDDWESIDADKNSDDGVVTYRNKNTGTEVILKTDAGRDDEFVNSRLKFEN